MLELLVELARSRRVDFGVGRVLDGGSPRGLVGELRCATASFRLPNQMTVVVASAEERREI